MSQVYGVRCELCVTSFCVGPYKFRWTIFLLFNYGFWCGISVFDSTASYHIGTFDLSLVCAWSRDLVVEALVYRSAYEMGVIEFSAFEDCCVRYVGVGLR